MKINKLNSDEAKVKKLLYNVQGCVNKVRSNEPIKPEKLARDLYVVGNKCKTPEKENILTNSLTSLAEKMLNMKQDNLAGIIYSFLIKFNKDNLIVLKKLVPKALEIAQMQKDSVHVAARTGELCQIYKEYEIHGPNYLACLNLRKNALKDICENYETVGERFRTISRKINKKDTYVELYIKTKLELAKELLSTNKQEARKILLSANKDLALLSEDYKINDEKNYSMMKKYISIELTNIMLRGNTSGQNASEQFAKMQKNVIEAIKEGAPVENSIFKERFIEIYDEYKNNSFEDKFVDKSLKFVEKLNSLGNPILANNICIILQEKNQSNIRNLKEISLTQMKVRDEANDIFGVLHHSIAIQRLFKKDSNAVSINSYLKAIQYHIKVLSYIIKNYDSMSNESRLKTKDGYIEQLVFAKVNSARLQRNKNPEYFKNNINDAGKLLDDLPAGYIANHPEMKKIVSFIRQYVD